MDVVVHVYFVLHMNEHGQVICAAVIRLSRPMRESKRDTQLDLLIVSTGLRRLEQNSGLEIVVEYFLGLSESLVRVFLRSHSHSVYCVFQSYATGESFYPVNLERFGWYYDSTDIEKLFR